MLPKEENEIPVSLSLAPYTGAWTATQAAHLLRRTLFGPTFQQIQDAVGLGMNSSVDQLLNLVSTPPPLTHSPDEGIAAFGTTWVNSVYPANAGLTENARRESFAAWLYNRANKREFSIQEKMCLFWQNHFAAEFTFDSRATYNYHNLLRTHALGNFKQFVKDITVDPCMLVFLNGASNNKFSPNENYSRELLELFSIGKGAQIGDGDYSTYKESDVLAGARILTGWTIQGFGSQTETTTYAEFNPVLHNEFPKELSEHFDNAVINNSNENEYAEYIDVIFQQPELATFICKKLYRFFVNYDLTPTVESTIISGLADTFRNSNYEILPVMQQLLKSQHFYDISLRGTLIKNPFEFMMSLYNSTNSTPAYSLDINSKLYLTAYYVTSTIGMDYAKPPSVGGWTAYYQAPAFSRLWANSAYIKLRFDLADWITLAGGIDVDGNKWGVSHLEFLNGLSLPSSAPDVIDDMITVFCPKGLDVIKKATLKAILTNGLPDFEWTLQYNEYLLDPTNATVADPVKIRVALTLSQLFKMPEFQTI
jgi:uncharacterized protein (DUF1800 family)